MLDEKEIKLKMDKVIESLEKRFTTIRAGRANPNILNGILVEYYGTMSPINSLATISIPEARVLSIKPFDKSCLKSIEKAINEANLGINPTNNGEVIMLTIPALTSDTRRKYVKDASAMAEEARVAIRNVRQEENNRIKKAQLREDEEKLSLEIIQDLTQEYNKIIDSKFKEKETELTTM